ncbi:elongator complex protein 5 isoform 4-T4 [Dama dama]
MGEGAREKGGREKEGGGEGGKRRVARCAGALGGCPRERGGRGQRRAKGRGGGGERAGRRPSEGLARPPPPPTDNCPNGSFRPDHDSVEWEGRSLLKALVKKSALRGEQVHVLGCEVSEEEFREGFDSSINSRLVYHDLFRDPLSWSKPGKALPGGPLEALRALDKRTGSGPATIALDSLSWLLHHLPCPTLCQTLHALSHQDSCPGDSPPGEQVRVLGLLHEELHGPGPLGALSSLAQTEVTLSGTMGQASAHILYRRPRQRPTHQTQWFSILPDFSLELQAEPPLESRPRSDPHTPSTAGSTAPWAGPSYQPHLL